MADADYAVIRTQLLDRRHRLESVRTSISDPGGVNRLLDEVDAALVRMEQGTYGICEHCHGPIEQDRLMADPLICLCLDHLTAAEQRALEQDLDLASRIQTRLLPDRDLRAAGWEAHYHYEPAGLVSGDYCDLVRREDGSGGLIFTLGDVSGKGMASSLLMSHLHAIIRSLLSVGMPVTQMVERANRLFCESTLPSHYATLVCGQVSPGGDVELCNAGHCPPVWLRDGKTSVIEATGLPLGLFCSGQYRARRFRMSPGDGLFFYTDGLTEARDSSGAEYGVNRLTGVLAQYSGLPAREVTAAVVDDLRSFLGVVRNSDDLTVMVIRRTGLAS